MLRANEKDTVKESTCLVAAWLGVENVIIELSTNRSP